MSAVLSSRNIQPLPSGTSFARATLARLMAGESAGEAVNIARSLWPETPGAQLTCERYQRDLGAALYVKAPVGANTTADGGLYYAADHSAAEFASYVYSGSIAGKLTAARRVPFVVRFPKMAGGFSFAWKGEGAAAKVSKASLEQTSLGIAKAGGIIVLSDELATFARAGTRAAADAAVELLRADMVLGVRAFLDAQFIDNSVAAVSSTNPASITYGATAVNSTGTTATALAADFAAALTSLADANEVDSMTWVLTPAMAAQLAAKRDTSGSVCFPSITVNGTGSTLLGIPVIVSNAVPHSTSAGSQIILLNQSAIAIAGMGTEADVAVEISRHATVEMDSAPTGSSKTPTAATVVSMFQANSVAVGVTAFANWSRVRDAGVYIIDNVHTS